jgi:enamine deaminase RidA (YjgF/YER057c/UK114 family)
MLWAGFDDVCETTVFLADRNDFAAMMLFMQSFL